MTRDQMAGVLLGGDSASSTWKHLDMSRERMRTARAWDKPWDLVIEVVKRLASFRIKSQRNLLPIMIGPGASVNGQQADLDVRMHFLFRDAMQFSKSEHGHQMRR